MRRHKQVRGTARESEQGPGSSSTPPDQKTRTHAPHRPQALPAEPHEPAPGKPAADQSSDASRRAIRSESRARGRGIGRGVTEDAFAHGTSATPPPVVARATHLESRARKECRERKQVPRAEAPCNSVFWKAEISPRSNQRFFFAVTKYDETPCNHRHRGHPPTPRDRPEPQRRGEA